MLASTRESSTLSLGLALGLVLAGCSDGNGPGRADAPAPERPGPLAAPSLVPEPLTATDEVLRNIEGRITASAGTGSDGIATMQVHEDDFDDSIDDPGFSLRSIMGRQLWLSAMLAERDYPRRCARSSPVSMSSLTR